MRTKKYGKRKNKTNRNRKMKGGFNFFGLFKNTPEQERIKLEKQKQKLVEQIQNLQKELLNTGEELKKLPSNETINPVVKGAAPVNGAVPVNGAAVVKGAVPVNGAARAAPVITTQNEFSQKVNEPKNVRVGPVTTPVNRKG